MVNNLKLTPNATQQQQSSGINVDINSLSNIHCPSCKNQVFQMLFIAKKMSSIQSPNGKASVIPLQIYACTNCGAVPTELGGTLLEKENVVDDTNE